MKAFLPKLSVLTCLLTLSASYCAGYEFTIEGQMRVQGYSKGQLEGETNYNFTVEVRDCASRIRAFGGYFSGTEYNEYGWDGTNSFMFIKLRADRESNVMNKIEQGKIKEDLAAKTIKSVNEATLNIYTSGLPDFGRGIEPIWLAYASGCFYRTRVSGKKMDSVWYMGGGVREAGVLFPAVWQMTKDAPQLLEYMADFTDGNRYEMAGNKPLATRMPKPFDVATTNSVYQVLSWTNIAGMSLPRQFQVVRYIPDTRSGGASSLLKLEVYEGVAHSIRPACIDTNFSRMITGPIPTQITDCRLAHDVVPARAVGYFSPTGKVASVEELKKSEQYKWAIGASAYEVKTSKTRPVLLGLILVGLIFPVWLLAKGNWKTN